MRIFGYVGSMRGKSSSTYEYVMKIVDSFKEKVGDSLEYKVVCANEIQVQQCKGCMLCYHTGCPIQDGVAEIKREMEQADVIIWASPVYVHQVSGAMKNLIDRLNILCYTLQLIGKVGISVSVSNTNGNRFVDSYMNKVLDIWGANVVANVSIQKYPVDTEKEVRLVEHAVEKALDCLKDDNLRYVLSENQKLIFSNYSILFREGEESCIKNYWDKNNYFDCTTMEEFIEMKKRSQKEERMVDSGD